MTYEEGQLCKCGGFMRLTQTINMADEEHLYLYQCPFCHAVDLHYMKFKIQPVHDRSIKEEM